MNLYRQTFVFKRVIKDSQSYHNYYNHLISNNNLPKLIKSSSSSTIFLSNPEEDNNSIKEHNGSCFTPKLNLKTIKVNEIYDKILNNKIKLNPISKRKLIYNQILNNSNSFFALDINKIKKLRRRKLKSLELNNKENEIIKIDHNVNFFNLWEKIFFPYVDYSNLKYNEYEIYKDIIQYENIIKEKINYFKKNKNENTTIQLQKSIIYKSKKKIDLTFDSLKITFKDMSLPKDSKNVEINFPFALLPIFYYKGFESFIKFLAVVIQIENNFEKIYFDENKISDALANLIDFDNSKEEESKEDFDLDYMYINNQNYENCIELKPPILKRNKNFQKFNYFIFFWTSNIKTFIVTITLPCIHLNILDNKIIINHFIDYQLLFYLYKRNFLNWEYYLIKYLTSYSKFRDIFLKIDSVSKLINKNIFLKEPKTRINTFSEEILINIYTDQFNKNYIVIFESFYITVHLSNPNLKQEKIYNIFFNFFQNVKFYEIAKYTSKIFFLVNFLEINSELNTLNFNYKKYDDLDIKIWMHNIEELSGEKLIERDEIDEKLYREFELFSNMIKIEFKRPKWTMVKLEKKKEVKKSWDIGKDLENDFIDTILNKGSDSWTNFLNRCLKKLNEPVPVLPELILKKKNKKKGNRSNLSSPGSKRRSKTRAKSNYSKI